MVKGSRDRTADREAYRNSPVWQSMGRGSENATGTGTDGAPDSSGSRQLLPGGISIPADAWDQLKDMWVGPDLPPGVDPEDVPS